MPTSKHRRRGRTRSRWASPPHPPRRPITKEERREDALLTERLHQLFGPPSIVHQGGDIDWDYEQYQEALAQLEAEGLVRPASEVDD
jgi:hypothetical protein